MKHCVIPSGNFSKQGGVYSHNLSHIFFENSPIHETLSEHEILSLQETFLTNGSHTVSVANVMMGRVLMQSFLSSLDCYHNVACLTLGLVPILQGVTDLYHELRVEDGAPITDAGIEEFLASHFYYDFLWIELTDELCTQSWFTTWCEKITSVAFANKFPLVFIAYDSCYMDSNIINN